jgi:hypothetical protein
MKLCGSFILLTFIVLTSFISAGEYGSITGRISDKVTNLPLIGAKVKIENTEITAEADEHGEFLIPYVRAGIYARITGAVLGFFPLTYVNVRVVPGHTTYLNYELPAQSLDYYSLIQNTPISKDIHMHLVSYHEIERSPAVKLDELFPTMPGIVTSDRGLHLCGGTSDDITYYVDGLIFMWPYITGWQPIPIPLSAVEQLSLQSSGIEAEYGEMRAGIVNMVTRQAGTRHAAKIQYFTDEIIPSDKFNFGYNNYNISLSGPLSANLGYFLSGDLLFSDAFQQAKYKIPSPRKDYHGYGKLTYRLPNARGQLSLSGFRAREQWVRWSPYIEPGNNLKYFDQQPMTRTKYWYGMAALDYRFSSKNLTSLRIGIDHFDRCYGNRDYAWEEENGHSWYDDYRFKAEHLIPYLLDEQWQEQNSVSIRNILVDSMMMYHSESHNRGLLALRANPWGVEGLFYTYGDYRVWSYSQHDNIQARLDMNQYFNRYYTLKSGIHFIRYNNRFYSNPLAWHDAPLWDYYLWEPYRIDGYIQNNVSYKNVSTKFGLRLDHFNPNSEPLIDTTLLIPDTTESEPSLKISPRLGIYLLMWASLKLGVNYEHYLRVYHRYAPLRPMTYRTTAYRFSANYDISRDLIIGCNIYYLRHNDWIQIKNDEYEYNLYGDLEYEDYVGVIGMQIDLRSQPMKYLTLNIAYNLQSAYGSNVYWWQGHYNYQPPQFPEVVPADFDERHHLRMELHLALPPHREFKLFKSFTSSLFLALRSGQPYTPVDLRGNQIDNKNSGRIPGYWNVDWKIARRFRIRRANLVLSALILNLFNTRQVIDTYNTTGDPDDHGDPLPSIDQFTYTAMSNNRYSPQADLNHDGLITPVEARDAYIGALEDLYSDPTNYAYPMRIQFGIAIEF